MSLSEVLALLLVGAVLASSDDQEVLLRVRSGVLRGSRSASQSGRPFFSFTAVPYAKAPLGDLRFAPPSGVEPWIGVRNATGIAPSCIQKNYLIPGYPTVGQEDCLYLNVYTPRLSQERTGERQDGGLAVMAYIHGGGWFAGSSDALFHGPEYIMNTPDVILVTFNYRLGALGFLSTGDAWASGNWGMKDQVAALKWVRDNIASFGGDPQKVTIFGQSAGAASVHYHMLSQMSRGLFRSSISQSGTALSPWAWPPSDPSTLSKRQGELVGCSNMDSAQLIKCLRSVSAENITNSIDGFKFWSIDPLTVYTPVIERSCRGNPPCPIDPDEPFLTAHPYILVAQGQFNARLPWMVGGVPQEGIVRAVPILSTPLLLQDLNNNLDVLGPRLFELDKSSSGPGAGPEDLWNTVSKAYLSHTPGGPVSVGLEESQGFINVYTDRGFLHPMVKAVNMHSLNSHFPVYLYEFSFRGLMSYTNLFANTSTNFGVSHCDDLLYLFHSPAIFPDFPAGSQEIKTMRKMVTMWTNFAKFGNPTPEKSLKVKWDPVRPGCHNHLQIGSELEMKDRLHEQRVDFWESLPLLENHITNLWTNMVLRMQTLMEYLTGPIGCDRYYLSNRAV